jgi:predicted SAM-dependent methyltransferase
MGDEKLEFGRGKQSISILEDFTVNEGKDLLRINLTSSTKKKEGFVDCKHNLMEFPWPFEDNSVYEFNCEHYLERIPIQLLDGTYGLTRFMEEVYRCLMDKGTINIHGSHYMSQEAYQDPRYFRGISDRTLAYYNQKAILDDSDKYALKCNFEEISKIKIVDPSVESKGEEAKRWAIEHYWNIVREVQFVLRKVPLLTKEEAK